MPFDRSESPVHAGASEGPEPLPIDRLRRVADLSALAFTSTAELEPIDGFTGQERALEAIRFGSSINKPGFNLFVIGPTAARMQRSVETMLSLDSESRRQRCPPIEIDRYQYISLQLQDNGYALRVAGTKMEEMIMRRIISVICLSVGVLISGTTVNAQDNSLGQQLYADNCASCHSLDGKGNGPIAEFLNVPPADLTIISKNNDGEFPFLKIFQIVDGRTGVRGHGNAAGAMPIWGDRISREVEIGSVPYGAELYARARLIAIVDYVESIQQN